MMRAAFAVLALFAAFPASAALIPWQAPDIYYTFGNLTLTLSASGTVDTATGRTSIITGTSTSGGLNASGVIPDVTRTQEVLVSGTPGNPFDPPVYETQTIGTYDAIWEQRYTYDGGEFPSVLSQPISSALTAGIGSVFIFIYESTTQWGSETFTARNGIGFGTLNYQFQFDSSGHLVGTTIDPSAAMNCCPAPLNLFPVAIPSGSGNAFDDVPRAALPFASSAGYVPEPSTALLLGLGLAGMGYRSSTARKNA